MLRSCYRRDIGLKVLIVAHASFNQLGGHERYSHQFANALATSLGRANVLFWRIEHPVPLKRLDGEAYALHAPRCYRNALGQGAFMQCVGLIGLLQSRVKAT